MATEKVILEVEVKGTGKGEASVKSLKAELRSLKNELGQLDPASDAFIRAAKRAGVLQDQIQDINNTVKAFNPEAKFQAFAGVLQGVANGFSAIQGAQALFGSENEDIQKAMLKTQGAIALATGLNGLMGMGDAFKDLAKVIKTNVVTAFATLKSTLITTGIGALVVAIGVAINEIMEYNKSVEEQEDAQDGLNKELEKTDDLLAGQVDKSEKLRNSKKGGLNDLQRELKLLEAKGATEKEIFDKQQEIRNAELQNLMIRKYSDLNVEKEIEDKKTEILAASLKYQRELKTGDAKKDVEEKVLTAEEIAQNDERFRKIAEDRDKAAKDAIYKQRDEDEEQQKAIEDRRIALQKATTDSLREQVEVRKKLLEAQRQAELATLQATAAGLNSISQLVGEQTAAGKALGVASATIDTYVGATKALAQGGALGFVSAAAVVAAGLVNVKRILAVQVPSISGVSANGLASAPSSVPQIPQISQTTQLNQNGPITTRQLNVGDNRVYVLESDITKKQKTVESIERKATIR